MNFKEFLTEDISAALEAQAYVINLGLDFDSRIVIRNETLLDLCKKLDEIYNTDFFAKSVAEDVTYEYVRDSYFSPQKKAQIHKLIRAVEDGAILNFDNRLFVKSTFFEKGMSEFNLDASGPLLDFLTKDAKEILETKNVLLSALSVQKMNGRSFYSISYCGYN